MAISTCVKCAGHSFELTPFTPLGTSHKLTIIQCSGCGAPIGVLDPATGPQIDALKNQIASIDERLNRIARTLQDFGLTASCNERPGNRLRSTSLPFPPNERTMSGRHTMSVRAKGGPRASQPWPGNLSVMGHDVPWRRSLRPRANRDWLGLHEAPSFGRRVRARSWSPR